MSLHTVNTLAWLVVWACLMTNPCTTWKLVGAALALVMAAANVFTAAARR